MIRTTLHTTIACLMRYVLSNNGFIILFRTSYGERSTPPLKLRYSCDAVGYLYKRVHWKQLCTVLSGTTLNLDHVFFLLSCAGANFVGTQRRAMPTLSIREGRKS